ncbi:MAG: hypothetical protein WAL66_00950 [Nitrososphaeraceae archaeon]
MVDLIMRGAAGKRGLMYVHYYGKSRAFISNYRSWQLYDSEGRIAEIASSLLSHETLHLTLNAQSASTSAKLDNLFGRSNSWEKYQHGLGGLDISSVKSYSSRKCASKYARTKSKSSS